MSSSAISAKIGTTDGPHDPSSLQELVRKRAEEIYIRDGKIPGRDLENWAQAEEEVRQELSAQAGRRHAVIVKVNGMQYVGEYSPEQSEGYTPGEFGPGRSVPVRFAGNKMFLTRPNGKELETTIVQKTS